MSAETKIYEEKMIKTIEHVKSDFASVRAGRANAGVLDRISVEYYGTPTPLQQVASISTPDPRTLIGSGKVAEIAALCEDNEIELVVFDEELAPSQIRNLEEELGKDVRVIDRSMLILDIFALHAVSREGKLQVELAQLKYTAPRLTGHGVEMSRLGGGIGTRGPGETKLESDRRHIRRRISALYAIVYSSCNTF